MSKKYNAERLRFAILKEINKGTEINYEMFGIPKDEFEKFVIGMQEDGYISGIVGTKDKVLLSGIRVKPEGEKYLKENSKLAKTYRRIKEIKDWIPGY